MPKKAPTKRSLEAKRLASRMLAAVMPMKTTAMSVPTSALTSPSVPANTNPRMPLTTSTTRREQSAPGERPAEHRVRGRRAVGLRTSVGHGAPVRGRRILAGGPRGSGVDGCDRRDCDGVALELVEGRGVRGRLLRLGGDGEALAAAQRRERDRGADEEADPEEQDRPAGVDARSTRGTRTRAGSRSRRRPSSA